MAARQWILRVEQRLSDALMGRPCHQTPPSVSLAVTKVRPSCMKSDAGGVPRGGETPAPHGPPTRSPDVQLIKGADGIHFRARAYIRRSGSHLGQAPPSPPVFTTGATLRSNGARAASRSLTRRRPDPWSRYVVSESLRVVRARVDRTRSRRDAPPARARELPRLTPSAGPVSPAGRGPVRRASPGPLPHAPERGPRRRAPSRPRGPRPPPRPAALAVRGPGPQPGELG